MGWVVSVAPRPRFTPGERTPGTHCTGGWVGPRVGPDTEDIGKILCLCRGSNLDRPVVQPVARHCTDWATRLISQLGNLITRHHMLLSCSVGSLWPSLMTLLRWLLQAEGVFISRHQTESELKSANERESHEWILEGAAWQTVLTLRTCGSKLRGSRS
jgi:hypothetical protein